jgi:hypothetical protein
MKATREMTLSEIIRSMGGNPEQELITQIFSQPHRTICDPEAHRYTPLSTILKQMLRKEVVDAQKGLENGFKSG